MAVKHSEERVLVEVEQVWRELAGIEKIINEYNVRLNKLKAEASVNNLPSTVSGISARGDDGKTHEKACIEVMSVILPIKDKVAKALDIKTVHSVQPQLSDTAFFTPKNSI